jgi:predicted lipoprotein with Yx(FWY)xxD motif
MRNRWWASTAFAAAALAAVAACGSSTPASSAGSTTPAGSSSSAAAGGSTLTVKTTKISGAAVLTNAKGFTLYWFAPDTPTKSNCSGTCSHYWPPVKGPVTESGIMGKFGTITRSDGSVQATYNGHPLYTYVGDTAPGQAKGNGLNLSGGLWYETKVSASGAAAPAPSSSSSSSGSGGYGY